MNRNSLPIPPQELWELDCRFCNKSSIVGMFAATDRPDKVYVECQHCGQTAIKYRAVSLEKA